MYIYRTFLVSVSGRLNDNLIFTDRSFILPKTQYFIFTRLYEGKQINGKFMMILSLAFSLCAVSIFSMVSTTSAVSDHGRYKLSAQNCEYSENELLQMSTSSLSVCAALCSATTSCQAFMRKEGKCGMLGTCSRFCDPPPEVGKGWDLYLPDGKTGVIIILLNYTMELESYLIHLTALLLRIRLNISSNIWIQLIQRK